ncbi:hypothetical protein BLSTO_00212 [Blastocystis sp. subtype 1]
MSNTDSSVFAPLGSEASKPKPPVSLQSGYPAGVPARANPMESAKIDSLRAERDLIDLSTLAMSRDASAEPKAIKADTEQKQKSIMTTLDQKRKELQRQNENLEKLNKELQRLDVPINKEITTLRAKLENVERELTRATKYRKQKEAELLEAIDAVSKLGDEKCALTERLTAVMYDFESVKQKKLKEMEEEMRKLGM